MKTLVERLRHPAVALTILSAVTFLLYCGTLSFGFVWDDHAQIVDNPLIRSWHSLPHVFRADLWYHSSRDQAYYRPLFIVWETLNYSMFQLKTWGWHLTTILLHIGASLGVFFLARKLKVEYWTALLAAAIFAFHPVHIECVAWISAGSDSMVTIFYLLAFIAFICSREPERRNRTAWYILSVLLVACAQFSKEMGVTFMAMVALYEWINSPEASGRVRRLYNVALVALPYFVITVGYMVLRHFAISRAVKLDPSHSFGEMIVTLPLVLFSYLRILVYPVGLNGLYFTPYISKFDWPTFFLPLLSLGALTGALCYWSRRRSDKLVGFAALWIVITLAPVLVLLAFTNGDFVRDRYLYLPSVGFAILMAKAVRMIPGAYEKLRAGATQTLTAVALCIAFMVGSAVQQVYWATDFLVYSRGYTLSPNSEFGALAMAGNLIGRKDYASAHRVVQNYLMQHPGAAPGFMSTAYQYLARIYFDSGLREQGHSALVRALSYSTESFESSRGAVGMVSLLTQDGDYDSALNVCSKVLAEEPDLYTALYNCGIVNFQLNRDAEAEKLFRHALDVSPGFAQPNYFLGQIMRRKGDVAAAETYLRKAIEIDPVGGPYFALGELLEGNGRPGEAAEQYLLELKYHPGNADAAKRVAELRARN